MRGHTIRTRVPIVEGSRAEVPCCWCGGLTDVRAETPFRPDLGTIPMHIFCAADVIRTFEAMQAGRTLEAAAQAHVLQFQNRLNALQLAGWNQ